MIAPPPAFETPPRAGHVRVLSHERTRSAWAYVVARTAARARPDRDGRVVHRFTRCNRAGCYTADRTPELVLALRERTDRAGHTWILARMPMRPNGTVAWIPRARLSALHHTSLSLVVDRRTLRIRLYRRGRRVWSAPVGIGKHSTATPRGRFYIREGLTPAEPRGAYGPYALGTSAYSVLSGWPGGGVVGIHGTDQPALVPGRPSHGCIRLRDADMRRLWALLPAQPGAAARGLGTPVRIVG